LRKKNFNGIKGQIKTGYYMVITIQPISIGRQMVKRGKILFLTWKKDGERIDKEEDIVKFGN
jgi:hypothetical protein